MSRNSYPSPVSSTTNSPSVDDSPGPAPSALPQIIARDHAETQNNFRQASAALEAAYRRIRQVRRSLLELSDAWPSQDAQMRIPNTNDIGPSHDAIMLTGPQEDLGDEEESVELERLRSSLPASTMDRLEQFEMVIGRDIDSAETDSSLRWGDRISQSPAVGPTDPLPSARRQLPSHNLNSQISLNSPISPARNLIPPRRSMLESQLSRRRESNPDDPSTVLGRRVAAREAAGNSNPVDSSMLSPEEIPFIRASEIVRDLTNLNEEYRQRIRQGLAMRVEPDPERPRPTNAEIRARRSLDANVLRAAVQTSGSGSTGQSGSLFPPRPTANNRRWRAVRADTRQSSVQSPSSTQSDATRLSILSNFSINNISTPLTNFTRERPLLFDEPISYDQPLPINPVRRELDDPLEAAGIGAEGRNYLIRRRMNPDGDEHIHNINLEWDDEDPLSWLMPVRERLQSESQDYMPPPRPVPRPYRTGIQRNDSNQIMRPSINGASPPDVPPRRRGWARLDADGNEIPSDEEEELERARSQYRARALRQSRLAAAQAEMPADTAAGRESVLAARVRGQNIVPVTRTSITNGYEDDSGLVESSPRVRLNPRDSRTLFGGGFDSVLMDNSRRYSPPDRRSSVGRADFAGPEIIGSAVPFTADPLPMPLTEMMPPKSQILNKARSQSVIVPKHASLAGR